MNVVPRAVRHTRLTIASYRRRPGPPFLALFINSIRNMKCEHCATKDAPLAHEAGGARLDG